MKKEGWKYCKLGETCKIYNGNSINADYKKEHYLGLQIGVPFIGTKDVSFSGQIDYENGVKIPLDNNFKKAYPGSVFICAEGGSAGRKIAFVEKEVCFGNKLFCIKPNKENLFGKYLYYYLNSSAFQIQFKERLSGLIGGVSAKKFNDIDVLILPLPDQQKIVEYLDSTFEKIDKIKEDAEKKIAEAKLLFQAALNEKLKIREGWKSHNLRYCCTKASNINWKNNTDKSFKYIDLTSVNRDTSAIQESQIITYKNAPSRAKQIVIEGDVIFATTRPTLRRVTFISKEYHNNICSTGFCVLRPLKHLLSTKYLFYVLFANSFYSYIEPLQRGANYPAITDEIVKEYIIPVPPLAEQQQIVTELDSLSEKTKAIEEKCRQIITECDGLKQAILKQVFE